MGAIVHVAGDEPHDPVGHPAGDVVAELVERGDGVLEVADHDIDGGSAVEGVALGEDFVEDAAERVHVGAGVEREALELFRGHEPDGAEDAVALVLSLGDGGFGESGEAEVEDFDLEFATGEPVDHEVAWFEVAVDESEGLGGDHAFEDLEDDLAEVCDGEFAAIADLVEGFAFEEFHDDEGAGFVVSDVVDGDDVGVLEGGEGAGLADEIGFEVGGADGGVFGWADPFEGDVAIELGVVGEVDVAEAALADFSFHLVAVGHAADGVAPGLGRGAEIELRELRSGGKWFLCDDSPNLN